MSENELYKTIKLTAKDIGKLTKRMEKLEEELKVGFKDSFDCMNDNENKIFSLRRSIVNHLFDFAELRLHRIWVLYMNILSLK